MDPNIYIKFDHVSSFQSLSIGLSRKKPDNAISRTQCHINVFCSKKVLAKSLEYNTNRAYEYRQIEYNYWHSERAINAWGYEYMNEAERRKALKIFELNIELFPDSWNVYDSYGEALLASGNKDKALEMYQKSLELNPENEAAKEILKQHKKIDSN